MEPDHSSPHWAAIVGDNWPEIPPGHWHALAAAARSAAAELDSDAVAHAARRFDDTVRASEGLRPIVDSALRQQNSPAVCVAALTAAAATLEETAVRVDRARNQILDIVDRATGAIGSPAADTERDEESTPAAERDRTATLLEQARAEVHDVITTTLRALGPFGQYFDRSMLDPAVGGSGHPPGAVAGDDDAAGGRYGSLGSHGGHADATAAANGGFGVEDRDPRGVPGSRPVAGHGGSESGMHDSRQAGFGPPGTAPSKYAVHQGIALDEPVFDRRGSALVSVAGGQVTAAALASEGPRTGASSNESGTGDDDPDGVPPDMGEASPRAAWAGSGAGDSSSASAGASGPAPGRVGGLGGVEGARMPPTAGPQGDGDDTVGVERGSEFAGRETGFGVNGADSASEAVVRGGSAPLMVPPVVSAGSEPARTGTAAGWAGSGRSPAPYVANGYSGAPTAGSSSAASGSPPGASGWHSGATESRSGVGGSPSGATGSTPAVAGTPLDAFGSAAGSMTAATSGPAHPHSGADRRFPPVAHDNSLQHLVAAAIAASAGPAYLVGDRVDGDLVLARTLLAGVLASARPVPGPVWAVSVLRHAAGVGVFVTTNEGRGWMPAGVLLPRAVSTPWVWSAAEGRGWEVLADPARVLAEFAAVWGPVAGARLTALVSSEPIDARLRAQLPEVSCQGSVPASDAPRPAGPGSHLIDRFELMAGAQAAGRLDTLPAERISRLCLDLAWRAHQPRRHERSSVPPEPARLRSAVLTLVRRGLPVPDPLWNDLRDAYDLLAVELLTRRVVLPLVPLGELRIENDSPPKDSAALHALLAERRRTELTLLLREPPTHRTLRDAAYADGHLSGRHDHRPVT